MLFNVVPNPKMEQGAFVFKCQLCNEVVKAFKSKGGVYSEEINVWNIESHVKNNHNDPVDWSELVRDEANTDADKVVLKAAAGDRALNLEPWSLAKLLEHAKSGAVVKVPDALYRRAVVHVVDEAVKRAGLP